MAWVYKRKNMKSHSWYVGWRMHGKQYFKKIGRSKAAAEKFKGELEAKIARNEANLVPRDCQLTKFFKIYLQRTRDRVSAGYTRRNKYVIDHFLHFIALKRPALKKISMIDNDIIDEYQRFRKKAKAPNGIDPIKNRTINIEVTSLKSMLNKAVRWDLLHTNPIANAEMLKTNDSIKLRPLTTDEVRLLLKSIHKHYYPIFYTALYTGLRESEVINLQWRDVDLKQKEIYIRAKFVEDGEQWTPKSSGKSSKRERVVDIGENLSQVLKQHNEKSLASGKDDFVFYNSQGRRLLPGRLRTILRNTTKKCGFPEVTKFHALRHTYATHLIRCGAGTS